MKNLSNKEANKVTRECLQTALIQLMSQKPFEKITITELVRRSGVSRTAFYRNYESKEEILNEVCRSFIAVSYTHLDVYKRQVLMVPVRETISNIPSKSLPTNFLWSRS